MELKKRQKVEIERVERERERLKRETLPLVTLSSCNLHIDQE